MLTNTQRIWLWIATAIISILLLSWIAYAASLDYIKGDAERKNSEYQSAYQQWSRQAATGDTISQYRLAEMHEKGLGVPQNQIEAHVWYQLSYDGGLDAAYLAQQRLEAEMSPQKITEAKRLFASYHGILGSTEVTTNAAQENTAPVTLTPVVQAPDTIPAQSGAAETASDMTRPLNVQSAPSDPSESAAYAVTSDTDNTDVKALQPVVTTTDETEKPAESEPDTGTPNETLTTVIAKTPTQRVVVNNDRVSQSLSVCQVQEILLRLGYDIRTVDGLYGGVTRGAIEQFQLEYGLAITGVIDSVLQDSLTKLAKDSDLSANSACP